jgi:Leucine-rich repeat (LRR) protein
MCIICTGNYFQDTIRCLSLKYCKRVTSIPTCPALIELTCVGCPNLTCIPSLPNLQVLRINKCGIKTIPETLDNLIILDCDCDNLKAIPELANLKELTVHSHSITKIPQLIQLEYLNCSACSKLTSIDEGCCNNLKTLLCSMCPLLTVPDIFVNLKKLEVDRFRNATTEYMLSRVRSDFKRCRDYWLPFYLNDFYSQWMRLNTNE